LYEVCNTSGGGFNPDRLEPNYVTIKPWFLVDQYHAPVEYYHSRSVHCNLNVNKTGDVDLTGVRYSLSVYWRKNTMYEWTSNTFGAPHMTQNSNGYALCSEYNGDGPEGVFPEIAFDGYGGWFKYELMKCVNSSCNIIDTKIVGSDYTGADYLPPGVNQEEITDSSMSAGVFSYTHIDRDF